MTTPRRRRAKLRAPRRPNGWRDNSALMLDAALHDLEIHCEIFEEVMSVPYLADALRREGFAITDERLAAMLSDFRPLGHGFCPYCGGPVENDPYLRPPR